MVECVHTDVEGSALWDAVWTNLNAIAAVGCNHTTEIKR